MLVLRRKKDQTLVINGNIKITVARVDGNGVRLAIEAPDQVSIVRGELTESAAAPTDDIVPIVEHKSKKRSILKKIVI
ncbi:carbon storage regulator [Oribacterium sp. NK2B42]|uniref:carbon storage regulator n=1 Tax=Oribacterium sp. NK2B42 TaxID=689781 RepID=UPI0004277C5D|nr:carbon storage regulator [Oribacterium sp. NK2B42]MBP3803385.1 carbon storage regulator [Oribacterium sp.]MBR1856130.1 carbon storage regulator [Oribacterium sp.]